MNVAHQYVPRTGPARESLREKGQFWTPDWIADAMVAYVLTGADLTPSLIQRSVPAPSSAAPRPSPAKPTDGSGCPAQNSILALCNRPESTDLRLMIFAMWS